MRYFLVRVSGVFKFFMSYIISLFNSLQQLLTTSNIPLPQMPNRGASPPASVRSKYDIQTTNMIKRPITIHDIHVALDGIAHAEDLVAKNQLSRALSEYQESIGILIRGASQGIDGVDSGMLKERAGVALNDAESVKKRIQQGGGVFGVQHGKTNTKMGSKRLGMNKSSSLRSSKNDNDAGFPVRRTSSDSKNAYTQKLPSRYNYSNDPNMETIQNDILLANPPKITWSDVAGLKTAKQSLQEAVILPLLRPDLYTGLRSAPRGILLYGPPGTGKTMLAKVAAHESRCQFFSCSSSSLLSKWHGEGEKILRTLFRYAAEVSPSIIFFDEIDALMSTRKSDEHEASRRFKTEFMIQVDGALSDKNDGNVLILGCTNCPWDLDDAVIRRFQRRIYVPLPDEEARIVMIQKLLEKNANCLNKTEVQQLVNMTEGYSCSDLGSVGREAAFGPLRDLGSMEAIKGAKKKDLRPISFKDFKEAVANCRKSVSATLLEKYDDWEREQAGGD